MKRIITIALLLVFAFSSSVFADGTGESEITAHVDSHYTLTIPATVDLTYGNEVEVSVLGQIEDGYAVKVYPNNAPHGSLDLTHTDGASRMTVYLRNSQNEIIDNNLTLVTFSADEINNGSPTKNFIIDADTTGYKPGYYSGTMQYRFECVAN